MSADRPTVAAEELREAIPGVPPVAVVLGSGLGDLVDALERPTSIPFSRLPGLPSAGVAGHGGRFVHGWLAGTEVLLQAGRIHAYEGHPLDVVAAPPRILAELGVEMLLLTNAAGGIRATLRPGDLVLVDDHLSSTFRSPLVGAVREGEVRFPDMSAPYDPELTAVILEVARDQGCRLARGTYAWTLGPAYETPAEVRMLRRWGADLVGMSTVPEVVAARAAGVRCAAISLVTNRAAGLSAEPLSHEEVLEVGARASADFRRLVVEVVARWSAQEGPSPSSGTEAK